MGRLGAALLATVAITIVLWLCAAIVVWLDSVIPAPAMGIVAVGVFVIAVVGDVIYDALRQRPSADERYALARREALARGDDQL
jgi:cytochrome c biogenesis protein CcdA